MTIKCSDRNCNYPDCTCSPCLDVRILVPSRGTTQQNPTVKVNWRGGDPSQALGCVAVAIEALKAELAAGLAHHSLKDTVNDQSNQDGQL